MSAGDLAAHALVKFVSFPVKPLHEEAQVNIALVGYKFAACGHIVRGHSRRHMLRIIKAPADEGIALGLRLCLFKQCFAKLRTVEVLSRFNLFCFIARHCVAVGDGVRISLIEHLQPETVRRKLDALGVSLGSIQRKARAHAL